MIQKIFAYIKRCYTSDYGCVENRTTPLPSPSAYLVDYQLIVFHNTTISSIGYGGLYYACTFRYGRKTTHFFGKDGAGIFKFKLRDFKESFFSKCSNYRSVSLLSGTLQGIVRAGLVLKVSVMEFFCLSNNLCQCGFVNYYIENQINIK